MLMEAVEQMPADKFDNPEGLVNTLKRLEKIRPARSWMLALLSTINPNHEVFDKGYVKPPSRLRAEMGAKPEKVPNINDFFSGLRRFKGKSNKKRFTTMTPTKVSEAKFEKL